jgi:S-adenosylmethionine synthetase
MLSVLKNLPACLLKQTWALILTTTITTWIRENVDLTPAGIINRFELFRPIYSETTNYGHFGKANLPWETVDLFKD